MEVSGIAAGRPTAYVARLEGLSRARRTSDVAPSQNRLIAATGRAPNATAAAPIRRLSFEERQALDQLGRTGAPRVLVSAGRSVASPSGPVPANPGPADVGAARSTATPPSPPADPALRAGYERFRAIAVAAAIEAPAADVAQARESIESARYDAPKTQAGGLDLRA